MKQGEIEKLIYYMKKHKQYLLESMAAEKQPAKSHTHNLLAEY